jgi:hypothetical protein
MSKEVSIFQNKYFFFQKYFLFAENVGQERKNQMIWLQGTFLILDPMSAYLTSSFFSGCNPRFGHALNG